MRYRQYQFINQKGKKVEDAWDVEDICLKHHQKKEDDVASKVCM